MNIMWPGLDKKVTTQYKVQNSKFVFSSLFKLLKQRTPKIQSSNYSNMKCKPNQTAFHNIQHQSHGILDQLLYNRIQCVQSSGLKVLSMFVLKSNTSLERHHKNVLYTPLILRPCEMQAYKHNHLL